MVERPVAEFMTESPWTVPQGTSVAAAWTLMQRHRIRHLPVVAGDAVVGLLSDRDLHLVKSLRGVDPEDVTVDETMSRQPFCVSPVTPLGEVARTMAERRLGSAVVVEGGRVVGIFTTTDALEALSGAGVDALPPLP